MKKQQQQHIISRPPTILLLLLYSSKLLLLVVVVAAQSSPSQSPPLSASAATPTSNQLFNLHEPRIELRYNSKNRIVSLDERSPNSTVVAIVFVSDEDSGPSGETSVSIEDGNELGHFKLVSTPLSNTVQVNGAPLSKQSVPEYNLTLVARDRGLPPKMSAVTLLIKLTSSPPAHSPLEPQPSLKPPVTDLMYVGTMLVIVFSALIFLIIIGCAVYRGPRGKKPQPPPPRTTSTANTRMHSNEHHWNCLGHSNL